jgi:hypothetical protein
VHGAIYLLPCAAAAGGALLAWLASGEATINAAEIDSTNAFIGCLCATIPSHYGRRSIAVYSCDTQGSIDIGCMSPLLVKEPGTQLRLRLQV